MKVSASGIDNWREQPFHPTIGIPPVKRRPLHVPVSASRSSPPATGEDRLDRTDTRKGKIMAGFATLPCHRHVTTCGYTTERASISKTRSKQNQSDSSSLTGWIPIKRFRFPLARDRFDLSSKIQDLRKKRVSEPLQTRSQWRNTGA